MGSEKIKAYGYYFTLLFLVGLLAHGLILINDGSYVDSWNFNHCAEQGQWDKMKRFWYEQGHPVCFWLIYLPFKFYFNIYLFKVLSFLLIILGTFVQFALLARFSPLSRDQALFVSAVALA